MDHAFEICDKEHNDALSFEEFKEWAALHPEFIRNLEKAFAKHLLLDVTGMPVRFALHCHWLFTLDVDDSKGSFIHRLQSSRQLSRGSMNMNVCASSCFSVGPADALYVCEQACLKCGWECRYVVVNGAQRDATCVCNDVVLNPYTVLTGFAQNAADSHP